MKPKRIWTKRDGDGYQALELHENGVVFWLAERTGYVAQFFVDRDFIAECFASTGRTFDAAKLPAHFVPYPRNG